MFCMHLPCGMIERGQSTEVMFPPGKERGGGHGSFRLCQTGLHKDLRIRTNNIYSPKGCWTSKLDMSFHTKVTHLELCLQPNWLGKRYRRKLGGFCFSEYKMPHCPLLFICGNARFSHLTRLF